MKRIAEKVKPASTDDYSGALPSAELDANIAFFKEIFKKDSVLRLKRVSGSGAYNCRCALFYVDGMVNSELLNESVVKPLLLVQNERADESLTEYIANRVLFASETKCTENVADMLRAVLYGDTLLLIDGCMTAITVNTKGWRTRGYQRACRQAHSSGARARAF